MSYSKINQSLPITHLSELLYSLISHPEAAALPTRLHTFTVKYISMYLLITKK